MDEQLQAAIKAMALDKGRSLDAWIKSHADTPTPWVANIHEAFKKATCDFSRTQLKKILQHNDSARDCAKRILSRLGSKDSLKKNQKTIEADLKRYLYWLGCSGVHELIIGVVERRPTTLSPNCEKGYETAIAFRDSLYQYLHDHYYVECKKLSATEHLGALIISLALDGVLSLPELKMAVDAIIKRQIYVIDDNIRYISGHISLGDTHFRRVHLQDVTFGLACSLPRVDLEESTTPYLNVSLQAFAKRFLPREHHRISLRGLFRAIEAYYRLQPEIPQIIVDYMKGAITSNSLNEQRFAQLFDKQPHKETISSDASISKTLKSPNDFERPSAINEIKKTLSIKSEKVARQETLIKIDFLQCDQSLKPIIHLLINWVKWIITVKGNRCSYALMSLTSLSQHLLPQLKNIDDTISTPDDWSELIEAITTDLAPTNKVFDAIRLMTSYLNFLSENDYEDSGRSQRSSVNARVITHQEIDNAVSILKNTLPQAKFQIAEPLIRIAYALGCRRWELLGLQHRDIVGMEDPCLFIRDNSIRNTKTVSSNRCNSLKMCSDQLFYTDFRTMLDESPNKGTEFSIFQSIYFDVEKNHKALFADINKALQSACRDTKVSFHTLRHTAVCNSLLSVFWNEIYCEDLLKYSYFQGIDSRANRIRSVLVQPNLINCFEHEVISMQVGHLSFDTTAEHYFHFFCLLRSLYISKVNSFLLSPNFPNIALASAGYTRFSRFIRDNKDFNCSDYLLIIRDKYKNDLLIYEDASSDVTNTIFLSEVQLNTSFAETCESILRLKNLEFCHEINAPFHVGNIELVNLEKLGIIERLYKTKINKSHDFSTFIKREPDLPDKKCRMILTARAEALLSIMTLPEQLAFSNDLFLALSHCAIQNHGRFRFKNLYEADRVMRAVSSLLSDTPFFYTVSVERSVKINGKVAKIHSPERLFKSLTEVSIDGPGAIIIGFATEPNPDLSWYRFRALVWVCSMIYLRFGSSSTASQGQVLPTAN